MSFPRDGFRFVALILAMGLLLGCASTSPVAQKPAVEGNVVVGGGTADDRTAIKNSNQQIFNAEHAQTPGSPPDPNTQGQSLP
jgi:hypothetical protein